MNLKPCPFCGGEAICVAHSICSGVIVCLECGFETKKYWDDPMTADKNERKGWKEIAYEQWNRRANEPV